MPPSDNSDTPTKQDKQKKPWTGAEKLRVLAAAAGLTGSDLGAFLRREGLHEARLAAWREAAEAALGAPARPGRPGTSPEARRIRDLERELRRKEEALAEAAALLVLKKKVRAIWGDGADITDPRSGR